MSRYSIEHNFSYTPCPHIRKQFWYSQRSGVVYRLLAFLGYSLYAVGTDGSVWSRKSTKPGFVKKGGWSRLTGRRTMYPNGYRRVGLSNNFGREDFLVHHLVLLAFVGPCPGARYEACHWNDVKDDNRVENLRWDTICNNHVDRLRLGKHNRGGKFRVCKNYQHSSRGVTQTVQT